MHTWFPIFDPPSFDDISPLLIPLLTRTVLLSFEDLHHSVSTERDIWISDISRWSVNVYGLSFKRLLSNRARSTRGRKKERKKESWIKQLNINLPRVEQDLLSVGCFSFHCFRSFRSFSTRKKNWTKVRKVFFV